MRKVKIYFFVSLVVMITYPLYAKNLPETAKSVLFTLLALNVMVAFIVFNPRRGAKPYFVCEKCNKKFPYPKNRLGGTRSIVFREFCPYCEKERLCYIKYYRNEDDK